MKWVTEHDRPLREIDSFKNKFDKIFNSIKETGDPILPPLVRRAKHIACMIQPKCSASVLVDYQMDIEGSVVYSLQGIVEIIYLVYVPYYVVGELAIGDDGVEPDSSGGSKIEASFPIEDCELNRTLGCTGLGS